MNQLAPIGRMPLQHLSINKLIQFGEHFLVGHAVIDAQHKGIFELGMKIHEDWRSGGYVDLLRPAVEKLSNLIHAHFTLEERVLAAIGYEDLKDHAAEHQAMRDELSIVHDRLHAFDKGGKARREPVRPPGDAMVRFILEMTVGHVAASDMRYCRALHASSNQPTHS
jgi:hemerythrin-like metal-binding protein